MKSFAHLCVQESVNLKANQKEICLLIHGYCDSPATYKYLIEELRKQNYNYYALLLPGHGTTPDDLAKKTWHDWYTKVEKAYLELKKEYKIVWVIGFSTGGTLSLYLAQKYPVDGIVLIAPFLRCPKFLGMAPEKLFKFFQKFYKLPYLKKIFPAGISEKKFQKDFLEYRYLPIATTASLFELAAKTRKNIDTIKSPTLILHGIHDRTSDPKMSQILLDKLASKDKKLLYLQNSQHVLIMDKEKDKAISEILATIKRWKNLN